MVAHVWQDLVPLVAEAEAAEEVFVFAWVTGAKAQLWTEEEETEIAKLNLKSFVNVDDPPDGDDDHHDDDDDDHDAEIHDHCDDDVYGCDAVTYSDDFYSDFCFDFCFDSCRDSCCDSY